ncbi:hypothetical protein [Streptomyces sp. NPDC015350]|uniref:hypothetical protein n=1 Tax=Streptomyces sp. NPDC015350 TaxID=3364955 RepID=UPI0036F500A3
MGTTGGIYNSLLLQFEMALINSTPGLEALQEEDIPLLRSAQSEHRMTVDIWEICEQVRRSFFGCRIGDFRELDTGIALPTRILTDALANQIQKYVPGPSGLPLSLPRFPDEVFQGGGGYVVPQHRGWVVGIRHLMEFSARVSEISKLAVDATLLGGKKLDVSSLLAGIYTVAYDVFLKACGTAERSMTTLVTAATVCDISLNGYHFPIGPALLQSPGLLFTQLSGELSDFDFRRPVVVNVPSTVRELIHAIYRHLEDRTGIGWKHAASATSSLFGHLTPFKMNEPFKGGHLEGRPNSFPNSIQWLAPLWGRSASIRISHPELFILPACIYTDDRYHFHQLFDEIAPPAIKRLGTLHGTQAIDPSWVPWILQFSIEADLLRGMVYLNSSELATALARHAQSLSGSSVIREGSLSAVFHSVYFASKQSPLGISLVRKIAKILGVDSPL